jgi:Na+/H+ antiporter NhaA
MGFQNMEMSLHTCVNEGLMALFIFLVGLELKREIMVRELASLSNAALPFAGAMEGCLRRRSFISFSILPVRLLRAGVSRWPRISPLQWASLFF